MKCYEPEHHQLDPYPIPREKTPMFINEPWMIDGSIVCEMKKDQKREPDQEKDNIRIYVPIDLNEKAILRRLDHIIARYGEANEQNEFDFSRDVYALLSHIEIYDQIWYVRHMPKTGDHSAEATELVRKFVEALESIPDGCAEMFPFQLIEDLKGEYDLDR